MDEFQNHFGVKETHLKRQDNWYYFIYVKIQKQVKPNYELLKVISKSSKNNFGMYWNLVHMGLRVRCKYFLSLLLLKLYNHIYTFCINLLYVCAISKCNKYIIYTTKQN